MASESLLDKIEALLRVADDGGATEHEAIEALAAAQRLAKKHKIDLASLSSRSRTNDAVISLVTLGHGWVRHNHRKLLLVTLASNFRCRAMLDIDPKDNKVLGAKLLGEKEDADTVVKLLGWTIEVADREVMSYCHRAIAQREQDARALGWGAQRGFTIAERDDMRMTWLDGFALGVRDKFREQVASDPGMALMVTIPQDVQDAANTLTNGDSAQIHNDGSLTNPAHFQAGYITGLDLPQQPAGLVGEGSGRTNR